MTVACAAALSALAVGSAATASDEHASGHASDVAARQCAAQQKADPAAFRALYGDHAMRRCIHGTTPGAQDEIRNASQECKAEKQADPDTYAAAYGDGRSAHGECVSSKVRADVREEVTEFKNAAQECKAERDADADAFRETYGSNENGRNALGLCVSEKDDAPDEE